MGENVQGHSLQGGGATIKDSPVNVHNTTNSTNNPITVNITINIQAVQSEVEIESLSNLLKQKIKGVINGIKGHKELDSTQPVSIE